MLGLKQVHHIAIIATDYAASKAFYCDVLGFYTDERSLSGRERSWKGDLALNGQYVIELFLSRFHLAVRADRKPAVCVIWRSA